MTEPINPNTNIPMSLQVEKLQQVKHIQNGQQQGQLAQQSGLEEKLRQQKVNENSKSVQGKIKDDKRGSGEELQQGQQQEKEKEDEEKAKGKKGKYIDIRI